ncbi:uncharacterized protein TNCV_649231 [Trichonephila clavipes]|nr:uncharacterized protein TNCV_649231 [Trichonephila clavipes]
MEFGHYCFIKSLSRLVSKQLSKHQHKTFICKRCLSAFQTEYKLLQHNEMCIHKSPVRVVMPSETNFVWSDNNLTEEDILNLSDESDVGYILEVDLEYPSDLHDKHSDFPLAPENKPPPNCKEPRLLTTLEPKTKYLLHYSNLKLYLKLGSVCLHRTMVSVTEKLLSYGDILIRGHGQNITAEKTVPDEVRSLMEKCPACCVVIGRNQSAQKKGVEKDWVDPKINDPKQGIWVDPSQAYCLATKSLALSRILVPSLRNLSEIIIL